MLYPRPDLYPGASTYPESDGGGATLTPAGIASAAAVGTPTVRWPVTVAPTGIASKEVVGQSPAGFLNGSFETDLTNVTNVPGGSAAGPGTTSRANVGKYGSWSAYQVGNGGAGGGASGTIFGAPDDAPVLAGQTYWLGADVLADSATQFSAADCGLFARWLNGTGGLISEAQVWGANGFRPSSWTRAGGSAVAPAGAVAVNLRWTQGTFAVWTRGYYLDGVTVAAGTVDPGFTDRSWIVVTAAAPSPQTVTPGTIASAEAFGTPAITEPEISPAGIASAAAVGVPTVAIGPAQRITPAGITLAQAVPSPTLTGGYRRFDFVSPSSPQTTTNSKTRDFTITVSGLFEIKDAEVSLYMTNPGGLSGNPVTLIAPNGRSVALIPSNGGGSRTATGAGTQDHQRTHFDSDAAAAWGSVANAPWVGRYRPSASLASLNGINPNGTWILRVVDRKQGNTVNTIRAATLLLDTVAPLVAQTLSPQGIVSVQAVAAPVIAGAVTAVAIVSIEAVGSPALQQTPGGQFAVIYGLAIPSAAAVGTPRLSQGPGQIIPEQPAAALLVELTTLHYPDAPSVVLAVLQQYEGLEVAIPLNDARTAKVTMSIYDDALRKVTEQLGYLDAYAVMLRVRYHGLPVFWGPITVPEWNGGQGTLTLNAVGPEIRLQHHYLKDGDPTSSGPLAEKGKYALSTQGLRKLRDAALSEYEFSDEEHGVPDLGIIDGAEAPIPPDLDPVPRLTFKRHDELWRSMQELSGHELAPDFEIAPVIDVDRAYAKLNCYFPQGTDRTGAVRFYYGFGPDNLADFTASPGGKIVTRATYVSSDYKVRKRATAWGSASYRGIYGQVEATDYDSTSDDVGPALTLRAKLEVRKYREPPKFLTVQMKPEAAISDPLRRHRYGRDFLVGDTVRVEAKKGWMRETIDARITKVTLRQTGPATVVPDLELVPDVGDGSPETSDG